MVRDTGYFFPQFLSPAHVLTDSNLSLPTLVANLHTSEPLASSLPRVNCKKEKGKNQQHHNQKLISYNTKENWISSCWYVSPATDKERDGRENKEKDKRLNEDPR